MTVTVVEADPGRDDAAAVFAHARPRLLGIAYRILGSWAEAEDIVQDAWLRWQTYDRSIVLNSTAFLVTTTTRLAINAAQSARARRESYVGRWLSEPVDISDDPAMGAEQSEALELGVLLLLERLSPTERAAYVLRQAFDYPYSQIAGMLQLTEVNTRQLVSRASKHIAAERRHSVSTAEQQRLMNAFVAAARRGDVTALENLFAADVVSVCSAPRAASLRGRRPEDHARGRLGAFWNRLDVSGGEHDRVGRKREPIGN
jgi:RNA polymerase sigma-70 factor (ECF subfamily)